MREQNLQIIKALVSFLLVCAIAFSAAACIKMVPKTTALGESTQVPAPDSGNNEGWELSNDNPPATQPGGTGGLTNPVQVPLPTTQPAPTTTIPPTGCDLKIQPETLNAAPGVYTFTALSPSASNAIYQWDIGGLISQSGPQNTFAVNMNSTGAGTISVTMIIGGKAVCKATSTVNIVQAATTPQCDLKIQPASLTANLGTYTFWATTSYTNALFIWDINGYQQAYGPEPSFSVTFKSAGSLTVSVTMVINGVPICKASSAVKVVPMLIK
ncbi:MAG: hypothetical protein A2Z02_07440 [Chloroflexi bacterium RBG_16_48_7]|nr:MAG: hypothetical protein A2Z02_07440 [Chloroflexi bacterium RBG_16_48_7]